MGGVVVGELLQLSWSRVSTCPLAEPKWHLLFGQAQAESGQGGINDTSESVYTPPHTCQVLKNLIDMETIYSSASYRELSDTKYHIFHDPPQSSSRASSPPKNYLDKVTSRAQIIDQCYIGLCTHIFFNSSPRILLFQLCILILVHNLLSFQSDTLSHHAGSITKMHGIDTQINRLCNILL